MIILFLHIPYTPLSAEQPDPDVLWSHLQNPLKWEMKLQGVQRININLEVTSYVSQENRRVFVVLLVSVTFTTLISVIRADKEPLVSLWLHEDIAHMVYTKSQELTLILSYFSLLLPYVLKAYQKDTKLIQSVF